MKPVALDTANAKCKAHWAAIMSHETKEIRQRLLVTGKERPGITPGRLETNHITLCATVLHCLMTDKTLNPELRIHGGRSISMLCCCG